MAIPATSRGSGAEIDPPDGEQPVLFRGVSWDDYDAMLRVRGERRFRITFDRGAMEVVFPDRHETFPGMSWDDYEAMLRIAGDGPLRVTYERGTWKSTRFRIGTKS